jgi:hypothetical protein
LGYFGVGALAGAAGAGIGAGISSAMAAGGSFGAGFIGTSTVASTGFLAGAAAGGGAGFATGFALGAGNAWLGGANFGQGLGQGFKGGIIGGASGALLGGVFGGIDAYKRDLDFWTGEIPLQRKLDYMMEQYKPELLDAIGEGDAEVLVGNNRNLRKNGSSLRNENGDLVRYEPTDGGYTKTRAAGATKPGKAFSDGPLGARHGDNKIFLSKNTVRELWDGYFDAEGVLFHEWCHAHDYYSGVASYLNDNYPENVAKAMLELRASQFTPNTPLLQSYMNTYNSYLKTIYPPVISKGR